MTLPLAYGLVAVIVASEDDRPPSGVPLPASRCQYHPACPCVKCVDARKQKGAS